MSDVIDISVVSECAGFEALCPDWEALSACARRASIFTTWQWQFLWWKHYGADRPLRILVARLDGQVVGIAPWYVQTVRVLAVIPVRVLRPVGTGGDTAPDDLDPLLAPGHEHDVAAALARHLAQVDGWDVASVTDLDGDDVFASALTTALAPGCARVRRLPLVRISWARLPATWDDYLAGLSRERRYTVRNTRRKFFALPQARFFVHEGEAGLDPLIDRLIELHHQRWAARAESHAFSSPAYVDFHRAVMHACLARHQLRLYGLEAQGNIVALLYCYRHREGIYYFQGGFDPQLARLHPGAVLMGCAIEHAIGEGAQVFDMLRGEYRYKTEWAHETRTTVGIEALRPGIAAWVWRLRRERLPGLKRRLLRTLARLHGRALPTAVEA